eukprot:TRINITY_DN62562_c0_g1_i1.p1 TRINITY_DN62562_c0_g1~~TRINITY_DN62562_c0_g1_i1.p1  ORF type:complete len:263 (-),score=40.74 TRINITY_DN62562_c0_g1_i1:38-805(-)
MPRQPESFFFAQLPGNAAWLCSQLEEGNGHRCPRREVAVAFAEQVAGRSPLLQTEIADAVRRQASECSEYDLATAIRSQTIAIPLDDEAHEGLRAISKSTYKSTGSATSNASVSSRMSKLSMFSWFSNSASIGSAAIEDLDPPSLAHIVVFMDVLRIAQVKEQFVVVVSGEEQKFFDLVLVGASMIFLNGLTAKEAWMHLNARHAEGEESDCASCLVALQKIRDGSRMPGHGRVQSAFLKMWEKAARARLAAWRI